MEVREDINRDGAEASALCYDMRKSRPLLPYSLPKKS
jgi:hypothetical protein